VDRQRARTSPGDSDPGGTGPVGGRSAPFPETAPGAVSARRTRYAGRSRVTRTVGAVATLVAVVVLLVLPDPVGATASGGPAVQLTTSSTALVLLSQTPWVTPGESFDLHLRPGPTDVPAADLGVSVSVYSCLSSVSGFDESVGTGPTGTPVSSTTTPLAVTGLPSLPGGGFDLSMPVVVGSSTTGAASAFTIHLLPAGEQCQSFPAGVFPVRIQLVDTSGGSVLGSFTTHLVYTEAPAGTQRLRVGVVLPVQVTQRASRAPSAADLLARPSAALAAPPDAAVDAAAATVSTIAAQHPTVPVTLQVSGQTVGLLTEASRATTLAQLGQLASTPDVHQLTAAPFTPVDAGGLVGAGLSGELALQVARGLQTVGAATGKPVPTAGDGLGPWITGDPLDPATVGALAGDGFRQIVLPAADVSGAPADGSTTQPFTLAGTHGTQMTAMTSDDDLTARFNAQPGNPVLAAHQLIAELAQLYYERPNGTSPRAVLAVAPTSWTDDPVFVDTLLGSLDGNPVAQAVTASQLFGLFPSPSTCRTTCRLTGTTGTPGLPVAAIRAQRVRLNGFATATAGARPLVLQLGDLVLGGEAQALRPAQQSAVVTNAGAALDAQLGQLAVEGDQTVTLTASSGLVPVTVVSDAAYPVTGSLLLSSDKLLFPNGETEWSTPVTLLPRHSNVVYVRVRSRASGVFRLDVSLRSPDGTLRLVAGELSVRSTSSSVVGVVLTAGAVVVLAVWWIRTSMRRRAARRAEDLGDTGDGDDHVDTDGGRHDSPSEPAS